MKKVKLIILAVVAVTIVSCSANKKCPAYSKINKTEVSKQI